MNTKTLLSGLVGGVAAFFLGWIIYGIILMPIMVEHGNTSIMRPEAEMIWWALILGNLFYGLTISLIWSWSGINDFMSGLTKGALFGLIVTISWDLMLYSTSTWYKDITGVVYDILASVVMTAIIGGVVGWMMGRGKNA